MVAMSQFDRHFDSLFEEFFGRPLRLPPLPAAGGSPDRLTLELPGVDPATVQVSCRRSGRSPGVRATWTDRGGAARDYEWDVTDPIESIEASLSNGLLEVRLGSTDRLAAGEWQPVPLVLVR